jgi:hypothetical protein
MDPTGPSGHHTHRAAAVVGEARSAVARLSGRLPGSHREPDSDGRSLVIAVGRATPAGPSLPPPSPATDPYETTASLLAWGSSTRHGPDVLRAPDRDFVERWSLELMLIFRAYSKLASIVILVRFPEMKEGSQQ